MRLLVDRNITAALNEAYPIAEGLERPFDTNTTRSQVQAASLTFTIGEIFIPRTQPNDLGGLKCPRKDYDLPQGHTAVIRTRETIHLTARQAGIGFPPAFQSLRGLLMTNPGHIDPGYNGPLHCTVINMAHSSFRLARGDHIMRILLFEVPADQSPNSPWHIRAGLSQYKIGESPITGDLLDRLSVDFVDVGKRAEQAAAQEISRAQIRAMWLPLGTAIATGVLAAFVAYVTSTASLNEKFNTLDKEFITVEGALQYKNDITKLQDEIAAMKQQLNKIQPTPPQK